MKTHTSAKRVLATALVLAVVLGAVGIGFAPGATAASCSSDDGKHHAQSSGSASCSADCNFFGCNAQGHDKDDQ